MTQGKYDWLIRYISDCMEVEHDKAKQIYSAIANDTDSQKAYTPKILLPIIHYLLEPWQGADCGYRVFDIARAYGLLSVYPLGTILQYGLSTTYVDMLMKQRASERKIYQQLFDARWLAALAINDLRIRVRAKGRELSDAEHRALSDAWSLARRLLNFDLDQWKKSCANDSYALNAIKDTERALREIANS